MKKNYGAIWDINKQLERALQLKIVVTSENKRIENLYWAVNDLPEDWENGEIYDTGIQINNIANETCPRNQCGDFPWK